MTKKGAGEVVDRVAEVGVVQDVEKFSAEFQVPGFVDRKAAMNPKVPLSRAKSARMEEPGPSPGFAPCLSPERGA